MNVWSCMQILCGGACLFIRWLLAVLLFYSWQWINNFNAGATEIGYYWRKTVWRTHNFRYMNMRTHIAQHNPLVCNVHCVCVIYFVHGSLHFENCTFLKKFLRLILFFFSSRLFHAVIRLLCMLKKSFIASIWSL